ncbi:uncharacterized protein APUU_10023S [Aspergillus puulaauensis]|uniref:3-hydroxyisobutyrate dehydrogenase n=1 Tax=Aspergillus puulaauensis TaxID=1220207 RepID=A0A7R7X9K4_9EURO|nr:uncharacterized protein APUU_10023S [Aspergillus puulaauensis]BCS17195.1 hypothetical protein APUU_10023S [Aspergillus puulaauensis]
MPRQAYGFIGIGAMGYYMAKNLRANLSAEDTLTVFDLNKEAIWKFINEVAPARVEVARSARELVEKSDNIFTALPEPQHVKSVFLEIFNTGPLSKPPTQDSRLLIDTSTINANTSIEVANLVHSNEAAHFLDSPMSGGQVGAMRGTLVFMVGGDKNMIPRAEASLLKMGRKFWHMGPQGMGSNGKIANNYATALNTIAAAEIFNAAMKWGMNPEALTFLMNTATGKSWATDCNHPIPGILDTAPSSRDYDGGFALNLMQKDLRLAITAAKEAGAQMPLGDRAEEIYDATAAMAPRTKDFSIVFKYINSL